MNLKIIQPISTDEIQKIELIRETVFKRKFETIVVSGLELSYQTHPSLLTLDIEQNRMASTEHIYPRYDCGLRGLALTHTHTTTITQRHLSICADASARGR